MKLTIYKITFNVDKCYYTDSRENLVEAINEKNKTMDNYKPYKLGTINGIIYNKNKIMRGCKTIEKFDAMEYYKDYLDIYINNLIESGTKQNKSYTDGTIKRFKYQFIQLLNAIELNARNDGETDDTIKHKINAIGLISV